MGLAEKRLAKHIQDNVLPGFEAELKNLSGFEPKLEILWDTFLAYDEYPLSRLESSVFPGLIEVFQNICRDELGKEALMGTLEVIRLENTNDENALELTFENKILYHKMQLVHGVYNMYSSDHIIKLLEKAL